MNDILNKEPMEEDYGIEKSLRPQFFNQYIGQDKVKEQLEIFIKAAKMREEVLDHVLLFGPRDLVRQQWHLSLPMSWGLILNKQRVLPLKSQEI